MTMKTITVLGALGRQGGSVVRSLVQDGSFQVRGVTSSQLDSPPVKSLEKLEVKMFEGSPKDPCSLAPAFEGADTAFIVVNFWDPEIMMKEQDLTQEIMDVAKAAGVKHVIYSALANVEQVTDGKLNVPHFTGKAKAHEYLQTLGFEVVTTVEPAAYYSNWLTLMKPHEDEDGTLVWTWTGDGKAFSHFDVDTGTGPAVLEVAKHPEKYNGKQILLEAEKLTPEQIVSGVAQKMGKKGRIHYLPLEEYAKLFPGADELAEMVQWFDQYGYYGPETQARHHQSGKAIGGLISFEEWLESEAFQKLV